MPVTWAGVRGQVRSVITRHPVGALDAGHLGTGQRSGQERHHTSSGRCPRCRSPGQGSEVRSGASSHVIRWVPSMPVTWARVRGQVRSVITRHPVGALDAGHLDRVRGQVRSVITRHPVGALDAGHLGAGQRSGQLQHSSVGSPRVISGDKS